MSSTHKPLAERLRPQNLDDFVGQSHLVGENAPLRQMLASGQMRSLILWGPPGVGKTTLARLIGKQLGRQFFTLSAISSGVKEVRQVIQQASRAPGALLFIDEIHRFNKAQQDALLAAVEDGRILLIGATTENPSFEVISALLSRCQVYTLKAFSEAELKVLLRKALEKDAFLKERDIVIEEDAALFHFAGGDARKLLNLLEISVEASPEKTLRINNALIQQVVQHKSSRYDKSGEQHYDIISAFIKSIRGSDPNAAVYWLARMIEGGEDPKFIARRLLIAASEDVGNANPTALALATNCFQAVTYVGYPEARIILSQTAVYLACSPKSNASYLAINQAQSLVKQTGDLPVPLHLRNAPTKLMKQEGYGKGYQYAHDYPHHFASQEYLPEEVSGKTLYEPAQNAREEDFRKRLRFFWKEKYAY